MTRRELIQTAAGAAALPALGQPAETPAAVALPKLPFATDALEPYIDAQTMEIHHDRHHKTYVDNLNKALGQHPEAAKQPVEELLKNLAAVPEPIRAAVRNNGGGHVNHALFWRTLGKPARGPKGRLAAAIAKSFGSQEAFEGRLRAAGMSVFGSGWAWAAPVGQDRLQIETSPNQDGPWLQGRAPLFGIDVWEHAYYLKHQNRRADYLGAVVKVIHWDFVSQRYEELTA
ncbi:MAG: superoxide dismutase [Acidobacteria bacterium]|nr:superoxide dismutase [Acidobacteriota bacterium]